jgi:Protein kinase domain
MATLPFLTRVGDQLSVGAATSCGGVTAVPLFAPASDRPLRYQLGAEVLATRRLEVTETGSVDQLTAKNRSPDPVLLLEGDHLIGAKQNRVITSTVLVGPKQRLSLPVVCVEQGRWEGSSSRFEAAATMAPAYLRSILKTTVTQARFEGRPAVSQGQVWSHIATQQSRLHVASRTRSLQHTFAERVDELRKTSTQLPYLPGACGVAIGIGEDLVSIDVFDHATTCQHYWGQLVEGAALEALGGRARGAVTMEQVQGLLQGFLGPRSATHWEPFAAVGEGDEFRARASGATASALVVADQVVHLGIAREAMVRSRSPAVRRDLPTALADRYRIVERVGVGGAKEVFRATDLRTGKDVAIARIPGADREELAHEVELAARIEGDGSPRIYESFVDDFDDGYMVMEYCAGATLAQLAARPLAVEEAGPILLAFARSLCAIHQAHVLHRDIKLENALLCSTETGVSLKILDFGISARARASSTAVNPVSLRGTLPYMAPEVVAGLALDARSDVYAFGVCCYRLLTGQFPVPPREHESDFDYLLRIRQLTHIDLSPLPRLPGSAASMIHQLLELDRARRPFMPAVVAAFAAAFGHVPLRAPEPRATSASPVARHSLLRQRQIPVPLHTPEHLIVAPCLYAPLITMEPGHGSTRLRAFGEDGAERWSREVEGELVAGLRADLDGDGERELYVAAADRLLAFDARGQFRYARLHRLGAEPSLIAIPDPIAPALMINGRLYHPRSGEHLGRMLSAYQGDGQQLVNATDLAGVSYNGHALQAFRGGRGTAAAILQHPGARSFLVAHLETLGHRVQLVVYGPGGQRHHALRVADCNIPTADAAEIARLATASLFGAAHSPLAVLGEQQSSVVIVPLLAADRSLPSSVVAFSLPEGRELWRVSAEGNPGGEGRDGRALLADLDGDGTVEVVVGTGSSLKSLLLHSGAERMSVASRGVPVAYGDLVGHGQAQLITASPEGIEVWQGQACRPRSMRWAGARGDLWRTGTVAADGAPIGPV